jgi:glycerate-2-kinase
VTPEQARQVISDAFDAALAAVDPRTAVRKALGGRADQLGVDGVGVVAIGKAAAPMVWGAHDALGESMVSGIAIGPEPAEPPSRIAWHTGSHPVPDERSEAAGRAVIEYLESADVGFVLFLISGGGSALAEVPPPGASIGELADIQRRLMGSGTPIEQLNLARRSLSLLKNGRLLDHTSAPHLTLVVSDVGGAGPEVIASGPTMGTPTSAAAVEAILQHAGLTIGAALQAHLDALGNVRSNDEWDVIADGWSAARAAAEVLGATGLAVSTPNRPFSGEARRVSAAIVRGATSGFTVAPGEATVTVIGDGVGGRNTEAAITVAIDIEGEDGVVFAALTTDGIDGPTDAAGAIVDGGSAERIRSAGLSPEAALMNNDSYPALDAAGDLVRTGPTGTNVADLWFVWRG